MSNDPLRLLLFHATTAIANFSKRKEDLRGLEPHRPYV